MSPKREKTTKRKEFVIKIYESEYQQIQAWVDKYQHLETGGDLFGLWVDDHTAVVQIVLGPGENCKRTSTSFYQDVEYLDRVGNQLTRNEGLCHIGEWHSHHRLGLSRPSGGDENTVWTNMDRYGIKRFFLFIATISSSWSQEETIQDITVNCFLFEVNRENYRLPVHQGTFKAIQKINPFRLKYNDEISQGAESINKEEDLKGYVMPKDDTDQETWWRKICDCIESIFCPICLFTRCN